MVEKEKVESLNKSSSEVETIKLEVKQLKQEKHINNARLESKDNEIIKVHQMFDTINIEVKLKETELKEAIERIRVLEEEPIEPPYELVKEIDTLKLEVKNLNQQS